MMNKKSISIRSFAGRQQNPALVGIMYEASFPGSADGLGAVNGSTLRSPISISSTINIMYANLILILCELLDDLTIILFSIVSTASLKTRLFLRQTVTKDGSCLLVKSSLTRMALLLFLFEMYEPVAFGSEFRNPVPYATSAFRKGSVNRGHIFAVTDVIQLKVKLIIAYPA